MLHTVAYAEATQVTEVAVQLLCVPSVSTCSDYSYVPAGGEL